MCWWVKLKEPVFPWHYICMQHILITLIDLHPHQIHIPQNYFIGSFILNPLNYSLLEPTRSFNSLINIFLKTISIIILNYLHHMYSLSTYDNWESSSSDSELFAFRSAYLLIEAHRGKLANELHAEMKLFNAFLTKTYFCLQSFFTIRIFWKF